MWRMSLEKKYCTISIYKSRPATTRDSREIIITSLEDKSRIEKRSKYDYNIVLYAFHYARYCFLGIWYWCMIRCWFPLICLMNMISKKFSLQKTHWCSQHNEYCFGPSLKIKRGSSLSRNFSVVRNNLKNEKK